MPDLDFTSLIVPRTHVYINQGIEKLSYRKKQFRFRITEALIREMKAFLLTFIYYFSDLYCSHFTNQSFRRSYSQKLKRNFKGILDMFLCLFYSDTFLMTCTNKQIIIDLNILSASDPGWRHHLRTYPAPRLLVQTLLSFWLWYY